jgi:hypothetical protein
MYRPPHSPGGHRRLNSIKNDDWSECDDEDDDDGKEKDERSRRSKRHSIVKTKQSEGETDYGATLEAKEYPSAVSGRYVPLPFI